MICPVCLYTVLCTATLLGKKTTKNNLEMWNDGISDPYRAETLVISENTIGLRISVLNFCKITHFATISGYYLRPWDSVSCRLGPSVRPPFPDSRGGSILNLGGLVSRDVYIQSAAFNYGEVVADKYGDWLKRWHPHSWSLPLRRWPWMWLNQQTWARYGGNTREIALKQDTMILNLHNLLRVELVNAIIIIILSTAHENDSLLLGTRYLHRTRLGCLTSRRFRCWFVTVSET